MLILQCFICVIPNGIHQGWIPVSTGMTNGLDSRLRGYDKTFSHKLLRRNDNERMEIKEKMGECPKTKA
jgi:hypothetical protein